MNNYWLGFWCGVLAMAALVVVAVYQGGKTL